MNNMTSLQPAVVFDCFAEVTKVPRPSKRGKDDRLPHKVRQ